MIIKAKFLRNGVPAGNDYSYLTPNDGVEYKVGDIVRLNERGYGVIVEIDVPEENVCCRIDRLKTFVGKVEDLQSERKESNKWQMK